MGRRLTDREKAEATDLATMWERSKHKNAEVRVRVMDEADENGRVVYEVEIRARGTLPADASQVPLLL